jgi:glycosyltransferase involved in cell wall biosynthesis
LSVAAALPRLTVITPSYNQAGFLEQTLRSVLDQGYGNLEYLVVDGGSTDGSRALIERYADRLSWWVSEKDAGQADAINKGLARATGDWVVWINSDDLLAPGALAEVARVAAEHPDADAVAGTTQYFDERGTRGQRVSRNLTAQAFILEQLDSGMKWHQPAFWMRRPALAAIGLNPGLHYSFDHEMAIRYLSRHPRVVYTASVLAHFRYHDTSKTVAHGSRFRLEQIELYRRLMREPEFAARHAELDRAARAVEWLVRVDGLLDDRTRARLARFGELVRGAREEPDARCTANTRRAARRILQYGGRRP